MARSFSRLKSSHRLGREPHPKATNLARVNVLVSSNYRLLLGTALVGFSLALFSYILGAEHQGQIAGQQQTDYLGVQFGSELADLPEKLKVDGQPASLVVETDPPLASLNPETSVMQGFPPTTPTLIKSVPGQKISFQTTFRHGKAEEMQLKAPLRLSLKPLYLILLNLFWPGIGLIALGARALRADQSVERPPTSRTFVAPAPPTVHEAPAQEEPMAKRSVVFESAFEHAPDTPHELIYGRFVKGDMVGQGAMGTVYRCRSCQISDPKTYALKVLLPEWSKSPDFRARFEREADICHKLVHPNLVRAYERGEKGDDLWMVMDFIEGQELQQWLQETKPDPQQVVAHFIDLCDGLAHAHNQGIVHRDLKPENIIVTPDRAVIADFGLAKGKHYATITKTNTTLGTPIYMPPEQVTGGIGESRGDLYSLGCILYECFSGRLPFPEKDVLMLLHRKLKGDTPPPLTVDQAPPAVAEIVSRLMQANPDQRYQSAEELKAALQSASRASTNSGS